MVLHDPSDDARCGFIRNVDPRSARRQFRVSLSVAVVLGLAIGTSAFALRSAADDGAAAHRAQVADRTAAGHRSPFPNLRAGWSIGG